MSEPLSASVFEAFVGDVHAPPTNTFAAATHCEQSLLKVLQYVAHGMPAWHTVEGLRRTPCVGTKQGIGVPDQ